MAISTAGRITSEQFLALPQQYDANGNRIKQELIRGEVVGVPTPSQWHDIIKNQICQILALFLRARPELGLRAFVEIAYAVTVYDTFVPDVSVIRTSRLLRSGERLIGGAPEIAIEVVSPGDTVIHMNAKIKAYLAHGSRSVWLVHPEDRRVDIHSAEGVLEVAGDAPITDPSLPGLGQAVSEIFAGV